MRATTVFLLTVIRAGMAGRPATPDGALSDVRRFVRDFVNYTPNGESIPEDAWRRRHRNVLLVVAAQVPPLLALGLFEGTESITGAEIPSWSLPVVLGAVGVVLGLAGAAALPAVNRRARTGLATLALLSESAVLVFFSGGFIEAHFHYFVVMGVVAAYEDWLPFLLGIGYVANQHAVFGVVDSSLVYNHEAAAINPVVWALIHATFVLGLATALTANWFSTMRSREETATLEEKNAEIAAAKTEAEEARAEAERRREQFQEMADHLRTKAEEYSTAMASAADGDLGVRLDAEAESEAMTRIAEAYNEMMDDTESTMREIQAFTRAVAAASEQANVGVRQVERASEEVSESVQEISDGAVEQREQLRAVAGEMNDLSATVEEVASSAQTVADTAERNAGVAAEGEAAAQRAIDDVRAGQDAIDATVERVESLDEQMAEISEILDLLGEVARQTNLLALNANIEAARVGETATGDGDGFGVVADEIKQLAEETQRSADEVETLIQTTQAETAATVEEARRADDYMEEGVEAVEAVVDAFSRVSTNTEETNSGVQEISEATDDQAATTAEVVSMVDEVTAISETTAEEAEGVSAAAQQQTSAMLQVSSNVESLAEQADRLQALLDRFDVGGPAGDADPEVGVAMEDGGGRG